MDRIKIVGGNKLNGIIPISGAKNAALPLMIASLLTDDTLTLENVPHLADVEQLIRILSNHGVDYSVNGRREHQDGAYSRTIHFTARNIVTTTAPYELVSKMRASFWVIAPLLARMGEANVSLPGGCAIGTRPVDLLIMAMEKLGKLLEQDHWDLIVVDTPPSRNALDFLDAPQRLGSFLSGRLMKVLVGGGRGVGRMVTGAMSLAMRGVSTIIGGEMLRDVATFVQSLDSMFGGFQDRAAKTYALLKQPGTQFAVVAAAEADALREAAFFVDRLSEESMPLAGLILNRTHPNLTSIHEEAALVALESVNDELARGVLRIHADRAATGKRELHLLQRFTASHPRVPISPTN